MTKNNEQIIIDGVDVTQCGYLCCGKVCSWFDDDCKGYDVCCYKQLKRKEQECEELKEQLTILDDEDVVVEITVKQFEEYKKLKAENEELKEELQKYKNKQQKELELNKLLADSFKEMQHDLYKKFEGNSLIEKSAKRKLTR